MPISETVLKDIPPGPYSCQIFGQPGTKKGSVYLLDNKGRKIATFWGTYDERSALAEFVIAAQEHANLIPREPVETLEEAFKRAM